MDLLTNGRGVVVVIGTITTTENGLYYVAEDNCNYINDFQLHKDVTVPTTVKAQKHKYIDGAFVVNEDYQPNVSDLQQQVNDLTIALAEIMGV